MREPSSKSSSHADFLGCFSCSTAHHRRPRANSITSSFSAINWSSPRLPEAPGKHSGYRKKSGNPDPMFPQPRQTPGASGRCPFVFPSQRTCRIVKSPSVTSNAPPAPDPRTNPKHPGNIRSQHEITVSETIHIVPSSRSRRFQMARCMMHPSTYRPSA